MSVVQYMVKVTDSALPPVPVDMGNAVEFFRRATRSIGALNGEGNVEVGRVQQTARQTAPPGWLICDGSAVQRIGFPALFGAIGTRFGAGDGTTTFNLPTQAQCVPPAVAAPVPQVITGGSVEPTTPPVVVDNPTSGTGANTVTGGRVPRLGSNEVFE